MTKALTLFALFFLSCFFIQAGEPFMNSGITAHRGNSAHFPENSMAAFRSAVAMNVDWIELDVRMTKDGQLVVIHDADTAHVAIEKLVIAESNYDSLAKLDISRAFREQKSLSIEDCPAQRIPLLKEVLGLMSEKTDTRISIQPKSDCVDEVIELAKEMGVLQRIGFNDGSLEKMRRVKELSPKTPIFWDRGGDCDVIRDVAVAQKHGFESMVIHQSIATHANLAEIKNAGLEAGVWTVNGKESIGKMLDAGAKRIYTDTPGEMANVMLARKYGRDVEIIAHRGESYLAPENTLPAIKLAWAGSADAVEIDIYLTADGEIVLLHDHTIKRYTGIDKNISECTMPQLLEMDFGKWKHSRWTGTKIAILDEVLPLIPEGKRMFIEIKSGVEIIPVLKKKMERHAVAPEKAAFICFSSRVVEQLKTVMPEYEAYLLSGFGKDESGNWEKSVNGLVQKAKEIHADGLDLASDGPYENPFDEDMPVYVWTVNNLPQAEKFIGLGIKGITTDRASWLKAGLIRSK